jgi:hypothetical protein
METSPEHFLQESSVAFKEEKIEKLSDFTYTISSTLAENT